MKHLLLVCLLAMSCCWVVAAEPQSSPVRDIGSRRELFLDKFLIERLDNASLKLHEPTKAPRPKSPLIGAYVTVIKDGDLFRAVYRSLDPSYRGDQYDGNPGEMTCYAESRDGHEWTLPKLGLVGNTHFAFTDLNNFEVARQMQGFLHQFGLDAEAVN